ncbi:GHMP family kinase ATP-binding protein [Nocardiopsis potens]|uniref:GHMP family kinase ATP-binding protein n=1 Tax=Nocardiopsis potens TaxID=1246458 RepID=UPI000378078C|nr:galactokinase family protein [Nocardiopsis potens]
MPQLRARSKPTSPPSGTEPEAYAAEIAAVFTRIHGRGPEGIWWAPGRAGLLGDLFGCPAGPVLLSALPWGVAAAVSRTRDGSVEARTADGRRSRRLARRAAAALRAAVAAGLAEPTDGVRVLVGSTLPAGGGLGAGPALECAVLLALAETAGSGADRKALARAAPASAERGAVLRCAPGAVLSIDLNSGRGRTLPFDTAASGLVPLVIGAGGPGPRQARRTARRRLAECGRAAARLGVEDLRTIEDLPGALRELRDPALRGRVRHVATEANRVHAGAGLLRAGVPAELGAVLTASHLSMQGPFAATTAEVDLSVQRAVGSGARGARTAGDRIGGAVVALVAEDRTERVRAALPGTWAQTAPPSDGARRLR